MQHFTGELVSRFCYDRPTLSATALTTDTYTLKATSQAKAQGLTFIGLTGQSGGRMKAMGNVCLCPPADLTPCIKECHLIIEHSLCAAMKGALFDGLGPK